MKIIRFKDLAIGDKFRLPGQECDDSVEWKKIAVQQSTSLRRNQYNAFDEKNKRFIRINLLRKVCVPPYEDKPEPKYFSHIDRSAYSKATDLVQSKGWKNMREVTRAIADGFIEIPNAPGLDTP